MPLILLGAPLGNVADASPRLLTALRSADVVAAEDTRRLARLAADLGIAVGGRIVSYFAGNESRRLPELVEALRTGATVALITDGGMPAVSDPGFALVRAAVRENITVTAVPGPSAVTTALALSGLPGERFCFEGFLPRRAAARRAHLAELADEPRTMVFFEAPHRLGEAVRDLADALGPDRPAVLARELTKTYEQVWRVSLGELIERVRDQPPRGEITMVVAGAERDEGVRARSKHGVSEVSSSHAGPGESALAAAVAALERTGTPKKVAIVAVAAAYAVPRRDVYDAVVHAS